MSAGGKYSSCLTLKSGYLLVIITALTHFRNDDC